MRFIIGMTLAVIVWWFSPTAIQDSLIFLSLLWVIIRCRARLNVWISPVGIALMLLLAHMLIMLPLSLYPALSARDFTRHLDLIAGMIVIPALFNTRRRMQKAMFFSAGAMALGFAYDLIRLAYKLGDSILSKAHSFEPFLQNHSNVASMMAGSAAFVFFYFFWINRHKFWPAAAGLAGIFLSIAYLVVLASRGPQIAFALACCLPGFMMVGHRPKTAWILTVLIVGSALVYGRGAINPRMHEKASITTFSERTVVWEHTWKLAKQHPVLGHGYGKRVFEKIYYSSKPPKSIFHYPHCHQYWLKLFFEFGAFGVMLYAGVWAVLTFHLIRQTFRLSSFSDRLLPGTLVFILACIHLYGLGDYPDNVVEIIQYAVAAAAVGVVAMDPATALPQKTPGQ